jgi:hypothetical protein
MCNSGVRMEQRNSQSVCVASEGAEGALLPMHAASFPLAAFMTMRCLRNCGVVGRYWNAKILCSGALLLLRCVGDFRRKQLVCKVAVAMVCQNRGYSHAPHRAKTSPLLPNR